MEKKTIAVIGATGAQGKGVVDALVKEGSFNVRAVTRNPEQYSGNANEAVYANLNDLQSLKEAFNDAYGIFVVTNFFEEDTDELVQGGNAIDAAKTSGVQHFIWSTLPDVETISNGEFDVPYFTNKAKVNELVKNAGFSYTTFVQAPSYFQNFAGMLGPQPKQDGTTGWTLPIDPTKKVLHMVDINDLGKVVAGSFLQPEKAGNGHILSVASELYSYNDVISLYKANGHEHSFTQVSPEVFSTFFDGAKEVAAMFAYFEKYTYMGPGSEQQIELAKEIATEEFVPLKEWLSKNI